MADFGVGAVATGLLFLLIPHFFFLLETPEASFFKHSWCIEVTEGRVFSTSC